MDLQNNWNDVIQRLPKTYEPIPDELTDYFDQLRQVGDVTADKLVKETLFPHDKFKKEGRQGYNHLLDIADVLAESPALALNDKTVIARELDEYPEEIRDYYDPIEAPDWVDENKLAIAGKLWQQDMLAIITVLYGNSLPSCYLMKNGIPALYDSAKLADRRYIYQRIYETGLMLNAVLAPEGLRVIDDLDHTHDDHLLNRLNEKDPEGKWEWQGNNLTRTGGEDATNDTTSIHQTVNDALNKKGDIGQRYLWGKGYIAAKKVRFLHATMRFMLLHPEAMQRATETISDSPNFAESIRHLQKPYDATTLGIPVNQEDQAYTLLTFAYCIPKGLENIGRYWSQEEKEAFLHTWKVIGYCLGIQENLMTDSWEDAEHLFNFIQRRQIGASDQAKTLTETVIYFFEDYLPNNFDLARGLATRLIATQLGEERAEMVIPKTYLDEAERLPVKLVFEGALKVIWLYYRVRHTLYKIPYVARFFRSIFYETGVDLVKSWRDAYSRKPFYIPLTVDTWKRSKGVNETFLKKLRSWRHQLFNTMAIGLASLFGAALNLILWVLLSLFGVASVASFTGWLAICLTLIGIFILDYNVGKIAKARPQPEQKDMTVAELPELESALPDKS